IGIPPPREHLFDEFRWSLSILSADRKCVKQRSLVSLAAEDSFRVMRYRNIPTSPRAVPLTPLFAARTRPKHLEWRVSGTPPRRSYALPFDPSLLLPLYLLLSFTRGTVYQTLPNRLRDALARHIQHH